MAFTSHFWGKAISCSSLILSLHLHAERQSGALLWGHPTAVLCVFLITPALYNCQLLDLVTQTVAVALGFWIIKVLRVRSNSVSVYPSIYPSIHIHLYDICMCPVSLSLVFDWAYPAVIESHPGFCGYVCDSQVWVSMVTVDIHWWWCKSLLQW